MSMIITSRKNETVRKSRLILSEKKLRDSEGIFGTEGCKLAEEALKAGFKAEYAVVAQAAAEKFPETVKLIEKNCKIYYATPEIYLYISQQKAPQGIFLALKQKSALDKSKILDKILSGSTLLMLDCVQDSGNLGTMIRTAEALGTQGVILGDGCADLWSPKTLRSAMGSAFRVNTVSCSLEKAVDRAKDSGFEVYAAMLDSSALPLGSFKFGEKTAAVIGNEGHGISADVAAKCKKLYIPITSAESLNAAAAAAVLCWEMKRKKR
ncbi:MAG: RNA methyltransferase [Firmicutes bacterium]|nr:RNA methyltransferase [[Eubacterium] siraeum]MCM1487042.1 RNA methyltransferase [Bacillota bacterium]